MNFRIPYSLSLGAAVAFGGGGAMAGQVEVTTTGDNYYLLHRNQVQLDYQDGITIISDFPVSSLRYNDNQYLHGQTPIYESELVVAVSSDCTEEELGGKPIVQYDFVEESQEGVKPYRVRSIQISLNNQTTADIDDLSFLDTSVFQASWSYESYWCMWDLNNNNNNDDDVAEISKSFKTSQKKNEMLSSSSAAATGKQRGGLILTAVTVLMGLLMSGAVAGSATGDNRRLFWLLAACIAIVGMVHGRTAQRELHTNTTDTTSSNTTNTTTPMMCKINVELVHDGCRSDPLNVSAPAIRLGDVVIEGAQSQKDTEKPCTTNYRANLTFPQTTIIHQNNNITKQEEEEKEYVEVPQIAAYDRCARMVEGRPFIDQSGTQIQASASSSSDANRNGWCTATTPGIITEQKSLNDSDDTTTEHQKQQTLLLREALGEEWTRRALGEHASVSSFAAFTIALMSNNAPPQLIQDSLTAAADEVRHAKVSFEAASKFLGTIVEPGPLPASSHKFQKDLKALGLATAQEGCIDETLSALVAALEVDELLSEGQQQQPQQQYITEEERLWLKEQMKTIALEEASHSALAWRTIQWVCQMDPLACDAVKSTVFDTEHLQEAIEKKLDGRPFSLEKAKMVWEQIHSSLIPLVTGSEVDTTAEAEALDLTGVVSQRIIERVAGSLQEAIH